MGVFDSLGEALAPKFADVMPKVDVSSFLPDFSMGENLFSSFGGGKDTFFSNSFGVRTPSFSGPDSWRSFVPSFFKTGSMFDTNWSFPWDKPPTLPGGMYNGMGIADGEASVLNQYGSTFLSAASKFGLDPNTLMAIAIVEQGWTGTSPAGAIGLMQIMPGGYPEGEKMFPNWQTNPEENIMLGAYILSQKIAEQGGDVDRGIMGYLGFGGEDAFGTNADEYLLRVKAEITKLQQSSSAPYTGQAGSNYLSMFGGMQFPVTSENGVSNGMPADWYKYAQGLGLQYGTHPGLDVAAPSGTRLYMPKGVTGIVEKADGYDGFGYDPNGGVAKSSPQTGQLRIRLSNGAILILGHMKQITVYVGQTVNAGSFLGYSGAAGSGAHLHLEYRVIDDSTSTGWRSVDPRFYLR